MKQAQRKHQENSRYKYKKSGDMDHEKKLRESEDKH